MTGYGFTMILLGLAFSIWPLCLAGLAAIIFDPERIRHE